MGFFGRQVNHLTLSSLEEIPISAGKFKYAFEQKLFDIGLVKDDAMSTIGIERKHVAISHRNFN